MFSSSLLNQRKSLYNFLSLISFISFCFSIIGLSTNQWMKSTHNNDYMGLFISTSNDTLYCDTNMSQTDCGYLTSSQASGVISLVMSFVSINSFYQRKVYLSFFSNWIQTLFGIICLIFYSSFITNYNTNDDFNTDSIIPKWSINGFSIYLFMSSICISGIISIIGALLMMNYKDVFGYFKIDDDQLIDKFNVKK